MGHVVIIAILIITVILVKIILKINLKEIKQIAENNKELDEIVKKYPSNIEICKSILKKLNNEKVRIQEDKEANNCLYIAVSDKILIANMRDSFTRIQTIAHECIHSIQNKKLLIFNFIFSNIYILYFLVISVLTFFNIIQNPVIQVYILTLFSFIYYKVRSFLETDAMTRAPYVAEEYMKDSKILEENEIKKIMNSYKIINNLGIKIANFELFAKCIFKIIIYAFICFLQ